VADEQPQRVRCPCCGEVFELKDALPVAEPAAGAAQVPITLIFDGGSIGNPGRGYGSYRLTISGKAERPRRIELGEGYTNNEAEYDTLAVALEAILSRADDPKRVQLEIRGDSQLVINQLNGTWKVKEPRMRERLERVRALLDRLGSWRAIWHERSKSVKALGH
jgi:ribonuclease HI